MKFITFGTPMAHREVITIDRVIINGRTNCVLFVTRRIFHIRVKVNPQIPIRKKPWGETGVLDANLKADPPATVA